jgi:hypothetical protein
MRRAVGVVSGACDGLDRQTQGKGFPDRCESRAIRHPRSTPAWRCPSLADPSGPAPSGPEAEADDVTGTSGRAGSEPAPAACQPSRLPKGNPKISLGFPVPAPLGNRDTSQPPPLPLDLLPHQRLPRLHRPDLAAPPRHRPSHPQQSTTLTRPVEPADSPGTAPRGSTSPVPHAQREVRRAPQGRMRPGDDTRRPSGA